jgi:hypothetical protein
VCNRRCKAYEKGAYPAAIGIILGASVFLGKKPVGDWLALPVLRDVSTELTSRRPTSVSALTGSRGSSCSYRILCLAFRQHFTVKFLISLGGFSPFRMKWLLSNNVSSRPVCQKAYPRLTPPCVGNSMRVPEYGAFGSPSVTTHACIVRCAIV